jgi:REP element-mobilizing transposase RayT
MIDPEYESVLTADDPSGTAEPQLGNAGDEGNRDGPGTAELQLGNAGDEGNHLGWHSRGYLPHCDAGGLIQHLTFHLADSLPKSALDQLERSIAEMPDDEKKRQRRQRYQTLLDAGHGSCVLRKPKAAKIVEGGLLHFDGERYRLLAWVIMPNHVHVLVEPLPGFSVARLVQSWKSFTARRINLMMADGSEGPECRAGARRSQDRQSQVRRSRALWQRDYWDRFIRNERHLLTAIRYIEENPVTAGLAAAAEGWSWGSARRRQ